MVADAGSDPVTAREQRLRERIDLLTDRATRAESALRSVTHSRNLLRTKARELEAKVAELEEEDLDGLMASAWAELLRDSVAA